MLGSDTEGIRRDMGLVERVNAGRRHYLKMETGIERAGHLSSRCESPVFLGNRFEGKRIDYTVVLNLLRYAVALHSMACLALPVAPSSVRSIEMLSCERPMRRRADCRFPSEQVRKAMDGFRC